MTIAVAPKRFNWDPVVKITHWSIALAVLANAVFTEEGSSLHVWVGYALAAILALRLLWGLIGPPEARFKAFWPSPRKALGHIRDIRNGTLTRHSSHNPLGAMMVYAIWACLLTIIGTGVAKRLNQSAVSARWDPKCAYPEVTTGRPVKNFGNRWLGQGKRAWRYN